MADNNATILIPDISGFTEFMTSTELSHGSHAINMLIDAIVHAVGEDYEVSEIEGDAVLLIRKGPAPTKKEILNTCLKIFNGFHFQRKWLQQFKVCPCGACMAIGDLTLKFVVHHGPLAEIKVGRFVKQAGPEMIVAHRLLKNTIDSNEYLLLSEKLLTQMADAAEPVDMEWTSSSDVYPSIGKIDYRFAQLSAARKLVPDPPKPEVYFTDDTPYLETTITANFLDAYTIIMNIPERAGWMPGLLTVEQDIPLVYIGSIHHCTFEDYKAVVSPLCMDLTEEGVLYAERCTIEEPNISLVYEFIFRKTGNNNSLISTRFMNAGGSALPGKFQASLLEQMKLMVEKLKTQFED